MQLRATLIVLVVARAAFAQAPGDVPPTPPPAETATATDTTPAPETSSVDPVLGTARVGVYSDSDQTTVFRALTAISKDFGHWSSNVSFTIDAVSSASVDVRSSPIGAVDVVTSASGHSSTQGGSMSDTRTLLTAGGGWKDSDGHRVDLTGSVASERDYNSVSGGVNGSYDLDDRNVTLLGGVTLTDNWVASVLDPQLHHKRFTTGWSFGAARVLTPSDAVRVRYDGKFDSGYMASPYRNVRFGDWTTSIGLGGTIMFANTIGSDAGLPETLPQHRLSNALGVEWVHALALGIALHPSVRVGHDSWGINSATPAIDARLLHGRWRFDVGYRYYIQSHASFFETKYTMDPSQYAYYTADKELSAERGGVFSVDIVDVLREPTAINERRWLLFFHGDRADYTYRGFELLPKRNSTFLQFGVSCEL